MQASTCIWRFYETCKGFLSQVRRDERGQAAMVVVAGLLLVVTTVPAVVMRQEINQAPIIDNSVLATAAMAAAKAGISDYIDHLYANPGTNDPTPQYSNYTDYCSTNVFGDGGGCTNDASDTSNPASWNPQPSPPPHAAAVGAVQESCCLQQMEGSKPSMVIW